MRRRIPLALNNGAVRARVGSFAPSEPQMYRRFPVVLRHREGPLSLHPSSRYIYKCPRSGTATPAPRKATQSRPAPWYFLNVPPGVARHLVMKLEAGHDPHAVGTNESATPLAPRQVGLDLVAQIAFNEPKCRGPRQPSHLHESDPRSHRALPLGIASSKSCSPLLLESVTVDTPATANGVSTIV